MGTYVFCEKNGNATITLTENNLIDANKRLKEITSIEFRIDYDLSEEENEI